MYLHLISSKFTVKIKTCEAFCKLKKILNVKKLFISTLKELNTTTLSILKSQGLFLKQRMLQVIANSMVIEDVFYIVLFFQWELLSQVALNVIIKIKKL